MIDVHAHIVYGVDDGPKSFEESQMLLVESVKQGVTGIVATSHFDVYRDPMDETVYLNHLNHLRQWIEDEGLALEIYTGHEVNASGDNLSELLCHNTLCIGTTNYLLVECSDFQPFERELMVLEQIRSLGFRVVLAHVERLSWVREQLAVIFDLYRLGYVLQVNAHSLLAGKKSTRGKAAHILLRNGLIHVVASDMHHPLNRGQEMGQAYEYLSKMMGDEVATLLCDKNPAHIVTGESVESIGKTDKGLLYWIKRM